MHLNYIAIITILIYIVPINGKVIFENRTKENLYVSTYYIKKSLTGALKESERVGLVLSIAPGKTISLKRPKRKLWWDRDVFVSDKKDILTPTLIPINMPGLISKNIGLSKGDNFIIDYDTKGIRKIYRKIEWELHRVKNKIVEPLVLLDQKGRDEIKSKLMSVRQSPYKNKVATVRKGNELGEMEQLFLENRRPRVRQALESYLGIKIETKDVPTIAIVASGGGYRAMYATAGFLSGAEKTKLLDTVTYLATLSGSTWMVGFWMAHALPFQQAKEKLLKVTASNKGISAITATQAQLIADMLLVDFVYYRPITIVDFYGALLANVFFDEFGPRRQMVYLSNQSDHVKRGHLPMPIYTAIAEEKVTETTKDLKPEEHWYEFTPFEIGGAWLGHYIPTWSLGRKFEQGISVDNSPEMSFGQLLGIYGSAFTATFQRLYEELAHKISPSFVHKIIKKILEFVSYKRLTTGQAYNFVYGMQGVPSIIRDQTIMRMGDAGINCNLPYEPISGRRPGRRADIIIFLDCSSSIKDSPALHCVERKAGELHQLFPRIDYTNIDTRSVTIFKDEQDPRVPLVIYMPRIKDAKLWNEYKKKNNDQYTRALDSFDPEKCAEMDFCRTVNFQYNHTQATQLVEQFEFNMIQSSDKIKEAIRWKIEKMRTR